MIFNRNQSYDPYQTAPKSKKKLIIVLVVLLCLGLGLVAVLSTAKHKTSSGGTSTSNKNDSLVVRSLGASAYIKIPSSFVDAFSPGSQPNLVANFKSPDGSKPAESMAISRYGDRLESMTIDAFTDAVTKNNNGPIPGITYEKIERPVSDGSNNGKDVLRVESHDDKTNLTITKYYYLYQKKVWLLTLTHGSGTFLDKSQTDIANSFIAGSLW